MSWDLYLVPPEHGDDLGEWLEAAEETGDVEAARRHAEAACVRRPELELGGPYGDAYQLMLPEASGFPLDVGLYGNHASISVSYWDLGDRAPELGKIVEDIVDAVIKETGWLIYDPQEDRIVGIDEVRGLFGSGHAHGVEVVRELDLSAKPKRKRRFGLF